MEISDFDPYRPPNLWIVVVQKLSPGEISEIRYLVFQRKVLDWDNKLDDDLEDDYDYDTDDVVGDSGGKIEGWAVSDEYGFTVYVGDYDAGEFVGSPLVGTVETLSFCVPTNQSSYTAGSCDSGYFPIFDITVMTWEQWSDYISEDSMYDVYTKVGDDSTYVYLFSHPNGDYPSDLPISEEYFDEVIVSFMAGE